MRRLGRDLPKAGLETLGDLLHCFPRAYVSYGPALAHGAHVHVEGTVVDCHAYRGKGLTFCELEAAVQAEGSQPAPMHSSPDDSGSSSSDAEEEPGLLEPAEAEAGSVPYAWVDRGHASASTSDREQCPDSQHVKTHRVRGRLVVPEAHYVWNTAAKYKASFPPGSRVVLRGRVLQREG